eukprot:4794808-Prymnesium_polylepis.1
MSAWQPIPAQVGSHTVPGCLTTSRFLLSPFTCAPWASLTCTAHLRPSITLTDVITRAPIPGASCSSRSFLASALSCFFSSAESTTPQG